MSRCTQIHSQNMANSCIAWLRLAGSIRIFEGLRWPDLPEVLLHCRRCSVCFQRSVCFGPRSMHRYKITLAVSPMNYADFTDKL